MPIHHTLKAWQHAQRLAVECAKAANRFPDIARDVGYLQPSEFGRLEALGTETSKTLFGLLRKISPAADRLKPR